MRGECGVSSCPGQMASGSHFAPTLLLLLAGSCLLLLLLLLVGPTTGAAASSLEIPCQLPGRLLPLLFCRAGPLSLTYFFRLSCSALLWAVATSPQCNTPAPIAKVSLRLCLLLLAPTQALRHTGHQNQRKTHVHVHTYKGKWVATMCANA